MRNSTRTSRWDVVRTMSRARSLRERQESIYYVSGESIETTRKSPALQIFEKDLEVLMFDGHLDEPCIQKLFDYGCEKFVSIQKADVKLDETDDEKKKFSKLRTCTSSSLTLGRRSLMI